MQQKSFEKEKLNVDYTQPCIPAHVSNFMPDVYRDGDTYYCILGAGSAAIHASGGSVQEAMSNWEKAYEQKNSSQ